VDSKRVIGVMGLGVKCGGTIGFEIEGPDENEACAALMQFCKEAW